VLACQPDELDLRIARGVRVAGQFPEPAPDLAATDAADPRLVRAQQGTKPAYGDAKRMKSLRIFGVLETARSLGRGREVTSRDAPDRLVRRRFEQRLALAGH
jgi:hypothetical protein